MESVYNKLCAEMGKEKADSLIKKLDLALDKNAKKAVQMLVMGSNFL